MVGHESARFEAFSEGCHPSLSNGHADIGTSVISLFHNIFEESPRGDRTVGAGGFAAL